MELRIAHAFFFGGGASFLGGALVSFLGAVAFAFFLSLFWELLPFAMMPTSM